MPDDIDQLLGLSKRPPAPASPLPAMLPGPGWPATLNKQRAVILGSAVLQKEAGNAIAGECVLNAGDEVELGRTKRVSGKGWVGVTLRDGRTGFIPDDTKIRNLLHAELRSATTILPNADSPSAEGWQLKKGERVLVLEIIKIADREYARVRDDRGREGFMDGAVKMQPVALKAKHSSEHDMVVGAIWCIGGIVVTAVTYNAAVESGGRYIVAWGAIGFGGIQFLKGLFRSMGE